MTILFRDIRFYGYTAVMLLSGGVLGISAYFASIFLPNLKHDFSIFALIPPSWTIFILLILLVSSTPRADAIFLLISGILGSVTLASWSSDTLGAIQCDVLGDARINTKNGTISARTYCDLSKVVEAFSWATFCLLTLCFIFIVILATRSVAMQRPFIWREDIRELPWFGEWPGYPGYGYSSQYGRGGYPRSYSQYPTSTYGGNFIHQPGQGMFIQPHRVPTMM
ncbi:hypothetical protein BGW80DRAFT_1284454 [Lactifluus volemus]|nr:hypothetical protein BGW80DRAFT_1284454 [Lactifluus volemus]